jgi:hypothetical protein
MKKSATLIYIVIFLLIIFSVPVVQIIAELKNDGTVQILELFHDVSVEPLKRAKTINKYSNEITSNIDTIKSLIGTGGFGAIDSSKISIITELLNNSKNSALELIQSCNTINRYVYADKNDKPLLTARRTLAEITTLNEVLECGKLMQGNVVKSITSVETNIHQLKNVFPEVNVFQMPLVIIKNLFSLFWDSRYIRPYEKKIENASVFATGTRPVMAFFRYWLFNDLGDKGIYGKKGFFFYRPDVQYTYKPYINNLQNYANPFSNVVDPELLKANEFPVEKIVEFRDQLREKGIDLLVTIVPGKPSIYSEYLSKGNPGKFESPSMRFLRELDSAGVKAVDLFTPFINEKKNDLDTEDLLYLKKDTHWKARGAWLAASIVAERIRKYPWYQDGTVEYVIDTVEVMRDGDIAQMSTLPNVKINELQCHFPAEKTKCYQVSKVYRDENGEIAGKVLYKDDYKNSKILLLGDSFSRIYQTDEPRSAGWISHIAYHLKQPIATIVNDGGASTIVREILARKNYLLKDKKLVVWEFVERDIRYGENGWKSISLNGEKSSETLE